MKRKETEVLNMKKVGWITGPRTSSGLKNTGARRKGRFDATVPANLQRTTGGQRPLREYKRNKSKVSYDTEDRKSCFSGIRLRVMVCPKFSQVFLTFSTLLFFFSFECIIFTITTAGPGIYAYLVVTTIFNGNTTCYVDSIAEHGTKRVLPCLQIYVTTQFQVPENVTQLSNRTRRSTPSYFDSLTVMSGSENRVKRSSNETMMNTNSTTNASTDAPRPLLLFQNEYNFVGGDNLYRRCSFLPSHCHSDMRVMVTELYTHAVTWGNVNSTYPCFQSGDAVMLTRVIGVSDIVHAIVWPLFGMALSTSFCVAFWKRNYRRMSRLYIYNSWSAS
ncbi:uncharacterized protein LOC100185792 [Ciona intestinalis]